MSYDLEFKKSAFKEWNKLGAAILNQLKKKLKGVLLNPHIPSAKLSGDNYSRSHWQARKGQYIQSCHGTSTLKT